MRQNDYDVDMWPLSLRRAVTGTKLEEIVELGGSYEEIKRGILLAYVRTPEQLWKDLVSAHQSD